MAVFGAAQAAAERGALLPVLALWAAPPPVVVRAPFVFASPANCGVIGNGLSTLHMSRLGSDRTVWLKGEQQEIYEVCNLSTDH